MPACAELFDDTVITVTHKAGQLTEESLLVCEPALTDFFCTAVGCFVQPAIGIYSYLLATVLANMDGVGDRFQYREQALNPHITD